MTPKFVFAFLPYLRTTKPVSYRSVTFRSTSDARDIPKEAENDFAVLRQLFFLRDNYRLRDMIYAFAALDGTEKDNTFFDTLIEFRTILAYLYSGPRDTFNDLFLSAEHASLYWFLPKQVPRFLIQEEWGVEELPGSDYPLANEREEIPGYETYIDGRLATWVTDSSRVYPPVYRIVLNRSQNLSADLERVGAGPKHAGLLRYFGNPGSERTQRDRQLLTAISWYNRANSEGAPEQLVIINLSIAFEALLNLPHGKGVTQRFTEAVTLLLGRTLRLESWALQFYNARSDVAHKGTTDRLHFIAADDHRKATAKAEYKPLIAYGRQIFQLCAATIIGGAQLADNARLASQLTTNAERFARICKTLNREGEAEQLIAACSDDVADIEQYRYQPDEGLTFKQMIAAARLMVKHYLATSSQQQPSLINAMQELSMAGADELDQLDAIRRFNDALQRAAPEDSHVCRVARSLISSVWHYSFMRYFQLKRQRDGDKRAGTVPSEDSGS